MKWKLKLAKIGCVQKREGFLFLPKGKSGVLGFRWLEYAKWEEQYYGNGVWGFTNWLDNE